MTRGRPRLAAATIVIAAAALASSAAALALSHGGASTRQAPIGIQIGDIVKVSGAPIGCIARFHNGERALDCRRIGPLKGTYGTILTGKEALVVRFVSPKAAKIVFSAQHDQLRTHTCG